MVIDILIVNWNSGDYLRKCIQSILTSENNLYLNKLIIADNDSKDESLLNLEQNDKIIFIRNKENLGFSKACNQGFKICTAKYILLLNPDTQLLNTTLKDCYSFMEAKKDIDILGCQLLDDTNNITVSCARFPTPKSFFYQSIGISNIFPKLFNAPGLMFDWNHTESRYVDQVMGAFMFIRKEIFNSLGYFDERFFVYFEELDFSKRLAESGGKTYFNTDIKAIHSGQGTTKSIKAFRLFLYLKSKLAYSKKHFSNSGNILVLISTILFEPISRIFYLTCQAKFKEVGQTIKSYELLLKSFFSNQIQT